ncbi:hypothetical protein P8452_31437 [Trifolium repens]|nr:hypothetical protein P8452_31437 [Trifolium repens]
MSSNEITQMEEGDLKAQAHAQRDSGFCGSPEVVQIIQKVIAEVIGTYFLIFAVMILVYSLGHISGAHFNPAVTVSFAIYRHFPLKQVPLYLVAQVVGSVLASGTLYLLFDVDEETFFGTTPAGSNMQSLVFEILTSFLLMFVVSAVSTDNRAIGELAGIAVGMTIVVDVFIAGPVSGASMNPARTLGPAVVMHIYKGFWVYVLGPFIGAILGASAYNLIRFTDKPLRELSQSASFLRKGSFR